MRRGPVILLAALPALVVFLVLVIAGVLPLLVAATAALVVVVATALLLRPTLSGLAALRRNLDALGDDVEAALAPPRRAPVAAELGHALQRAERQRRAQRLRREGELRAAAAALDALPDPVMLLDAERRVVRANRAALEFLGAAPVGRDLAQSLRSPAVLAAADAVLRGEAVRTVELAAAEDRHLSAQVAPLAPAEGSDSAGAVLILHDITALRRAERVRADFVAHASHELRTPLASLTGFLETLRGPARDDDEARERFLAIMADQAGRMTRLVDDLLQLSRIEAHEHQAPTSEIELEPVLRGVADSLGLAAASRGARIELDIAPDLPLVLGAGDELTRLFQNLVDNALKYGRPGSPVEITAAAEDDAMVRVAVRDEGEGIPREHIPRLTERFYRVDAARSRAVGGTGLGLAIVKHIVGRHRGALSIESEPGIGSTFTVRLRAAP